MSVIRPWDFSDPNETILDKRFFGQRDFTGEADARGEFAGHVDYLVHRGASSFDGIKIPVAASVSMAALRRASAHGSRQC
jgi:hypothetical protein